MGSQDCGFDNNDMKEATPAFWVMSGGVTFSGLHFRRCFWSALYIDLTSVGPGDPVDVAVDSCVFQDNAGVVSGAAIMAIGTNLAVSNRWLHACTHA